MNTFELIAPCHFGLEAVLKREIYDLGYDISQVEDGKVTFIGDAEAIARANINLRTTERILLKVGQFKATTFTELFDQTKELPWEEFIPKNGKFWVTKANSVNSKLFSSSDIQSIVKKAIVDRLKDKYSVNWFDEDGESYPIRVTIMKDMVTLALDTTGVSLHKRGYRPVAGKAPISETLAAALIMLTPWKKYRILVDPFCGSGTFAIEAAMMAANIAPGVERNFQAEKWTNFIDKSLWKDAREEARDLEELDVETEIQAYDIDEEVIKKARINAKRAGVDHLIHFQNRGVEELSHHKKYGFIITNPPYGERLEDKETLPKIYSDFGRQAALLDTWSVYMITSYEDAQKYYGKKADKNRKIYNGMLKTYFYSYIGPKPPKKTDKQLQYEHIYNTYIIYLTSTKNKYLSECNRK